MIININQLHTVVEKLYNNEFIDRQQGKTTALIHLLMGNVWVGTRFGKYMYVGYCSRDSQRVMHLFANLLQENGYTIEDCTKTCLIVHETKQTFWFYGINVLTERLFCGTTYDNVFIDSLPTNTPAENLYALILLELHIIYNC